MELFYHILESIREGFSHHIIFSLGLLFISGFFLEQIVLKFKLPSITGYILAGIIIGDSVLGLIHPTNSQQLHLISEITLSLIAVIIGAEFSIKKLKKYGKNIIILTLFQLFFSFAFISFFLYIAKMPLYVSLLLGAIGAATAPAAVVVIVEQMRVRGDFIDYLYGIVALDDAGTVILFSITFAFSSSIISGVNLHLAHSLYSAFEEIFASILIGFIGGIAIHFLTIKKRNWNQIKIISLGIIFIVTSISITLKLSPLITNMMIGFMIVNINDRNLRILKILEPITPPLYALFFAIAGVELNLSIFSNYRVLFLALIFIFMRFLGKYFGIYLPAMMFNMKNNIKKYLGLSLLPQAGVAIGLAIFVRTSPVVAKASTAITYQISEMINIILVAVVINELLGPPIAKYAINKAFKRR